MEETASVIVKRIPSSMTKSEFDVFVDDKRRLAVLADQEQIVLPVTPGHHRIQVLGAGVVKSPELRFSVEGDESTTFECGYNGMRLLLFIAGLIFAISAVDVVYNMADGAIPIEKWVVKPFLWIGYFILASRPGAILFLKPFTKPNE